MRSDGIRQFAVIFYLVDRHQNLGRSLFGKFDIFLKLRQNGANQSFQLLIVVFYLRQNGYVCFHKGFGVVKLVDFNPLQPLNQNLYRTVRQPQQL